MAIDFRCKQCSKLLTVADDAAGKMARCPQCGATLPIPPTSDPDAMPPPQEADEFVAASRAPERDNPYRSPGAEAADFGPRQIRPTLIDVGDVVGRTWVIYKANLGLCVGVSLLAWVLSAAVSGVAVSIGGHHARFPQGSIANLAADVFVVWLLLGHMYFSLRLARGEPASLADLFAAGPFFLVGAAVGIITVVLATIGLVLLVVPGVIIWLTLAPSIYVAIDQRTGIPESLLMGRRISEGNKVAMFGLWALAFGLFVAICGLTCGLGLFLVQPFLHLMWAVTYLAMTGQPTAADAHAPREARFEAPALGRQAT
jgi:uncharacterized membrane protein